MNPDGQAPEPLDGNESTAIFRLPHWFMSEEEWELLLRASEKTQQPILRSALGLTSLLGDTGNTAIREHIVAQCIIECFRGAEGDSPDQIGSPLIDAGIMQQAMRQLITQIHSPRIGI